MPQNNKDFKQLQAKWYAKLKKEGFEDIERAEDLMHPEYDLKAWHSKRFQINNTPESFQQRERYYQLAGQFTYDHEFSEASERQIWQLHAEGLSIREICRRLSKQNLKRDKVFTVLKRLREAMLKTYGVK